MSNFLLLAYLSVISAFVPATLGIVVFKNLEKTLKLLSVFCIVNLSMEVVATILGYHKINNMFILHLHTPIELGLILIIAKNIYNTRKTFIVITSILFITFLLFCILDTIYFESLLLFNSIPRGIEGIFVICLCIYFFYNLFVSEETLNLTSYPFFWLYSGWLIYFSGTFFLFMYSFENNLNATFSVIHSVLNIFLNLIFTYTLWLGSKKLIA